MRLDVKGTAKVTRWNGTQGEGCFCFVEQLINTASHAHGAVRPGGGDLGVISKVARPDHPAPSTAIRLPEHLCDTAELHAKKNDIGDKHKAVRRYQRRMDSAVVRKSEHYCNRQKDGP